MANSIGERMKRNYESPSRFQLTRRTPVIVRIDGRAFHTFTSKHFPGTFSQKFHDAMVLAAIRTASEMQGFKLGYVQSDEASFLLTDYDNLHTQPWFGYNQSKVESISASTMTAAFARCMRLVGVTDLATFDARAFNIPEDEVANYFLWRAKDWERNSLSMYTLRYFSHRDLQGVSSAGRHELLHSEGKNWTRDLHTWEKNGTYITREGDTLEKVRSSYQRIEELWRASLKFET